MTKRLLSALLAVCLMLALLPAAQASQLMPAKPFGTVEISWQPNPRCPDSTAPADRNHAVADTQPQSWDLTQFGTRDEAVTVLRQQMVARCDTVNVKFRDKIFTTDDEFYAMVGALVDAAFAHTGIPTEGDYLLWQYAGYNCSGYYLTDDGEAYYDLTFYIPFYTTADQEVAVDEAVEDILANIDTENGSDHEILCAIYDYLCDNVTYDYDALCDCTDTLAHSAYGALIDNNCVCQGYALALYRLALECDIDCRLITGFSSQEYHAWNIAQLDGLYYNLDATWDAGSAEYDYFLRCSDNFTNHDRESIYDTQEFHQAYPMGSTDYSPDAGEAVTASGTCGDGLTWTLREGALMLCGSGEIPDYSARRGSQAPWHEYRKEITTVIISGGITRIGDYAFDRCKHLDSVYYCATGDDWLSVTVGQGNSALECATYHYETHTPGAEASCSSDQLCLACGEVLATGHTYGDWYKADDATERRDCACGAYETRTIEYENPFTDIPEGKYYTDPVLWAYHNGITSGTSDTTFGASNTCTRAHVVTFLWKAAGSPEPETTVNPFSDVSEGRYYYKAVLWAYENGITSGTGNGKFGVNDPCTRAQVVTFLWIAAGRPEPESTENNFPDVVTGKYYYKAVLWAVENGITAGQADGSFGVSTTCTRAHVMTFLYTTVVKNEIELNP